MAITPLPGIIQYYQEFKAAIFTSSLTLGTFLFTMKTFIVQTMKREVYDNDDYQTDALARIKEDKKESIYGPLKNFKCLIFWTIVTAFVNSLMQLTLGYFKTITTTIVCFSLTGMSWIMAMIVLVLVSRNLTRMIEISERNARNIRK
jgi:hypothetical protein